MSKSGEKRISLIRPKKTLNINVQDIIEMRKWIGKVKSIKYLQYNDESDNENKNNKRNKKLKYGSALKKRKLY